MKHFFTISLCFLALSLSAQETITYPYNPDGDADGLVAVPDIQDLLAVYGNPFSPAEIMVGDTALSEWIQILYQALQDQQEVIEAMQGAGGCDVRFPDGLDGEYFTTLLRDADMNDYPYTVPFGKTLYVTSVYTGHHVLITNDTGEASKIISGSNGGVSSTEYKSLHNPIILHEGQTISGYGNPGTLASMNGFLVNAGVEPITWNGGTYQVPLGKTLYVTNIRGSLYLYLENDDEFILLADGAGNNHTIGAPIVFNSDQIVHVFGGNTNDGGTVNGYLVDEDYFADCGGGGSSEGDNYQIWSVNDPQNTDLYGDFLYFTASELEETITSVYNSDTLIIPNGTNFYPGNFVLNNCELKLLREGETYWQYPRLEEDKKLDQIGSNIYTEGDTIIFFAEIGGTPSNSINEGSTLYASVIGKTVQTSTLITPVYEYFKLNSNPEYSVPLNSKLRVFSYSSATSPLELIVDHPNNESPQYFPITYLNGSTWPAGTNLMPISNDDGYFIISGYLIND